MKSLRESILDDLDTQIKKGDDDIKNEIKAFLNENYNGTFKISNKPNKDGLYEVSSTSGIEVKNIINMTSLTNGMFIWSNVDGFFSATACDSLKSLEGAPKKVRGMFTCFGCESLESLEGAPKEVGGGFYCTMCNSLESLEGAPKKVGEDFDCRYCVSLESLEGAPKEVGGDFDCYNCTNLKSLTGAPKKVGEDFNCQYCKTKFTKEDVKKVSNVKGKIIC